MARRGNVCIIFVKWPELNRVKTRLAKGSSSTFALEFYKLCSQHIIRKISSQIYYNGSQIEWSCTIAFSPSHQEQAVRQWLNPLGKDLEFQAQLNNPDLGERMSHSIRQALSQGARKVLLVGSDIPDLSVEILKAAFSVLESAEVVFGPAVDGGFYLIGGSKLDPSIFRGVQWSTDTVLARSLVNCERAGVHSDHKSLPILQDIDTMQDLESWLAEGQPTDLKNAVQELINKHLRTGAQE